MEHIPASRRVFEIPELVDMIFEELDEAELRVMARATKAIHSLAVKRLWGRKTINILKLTRLFPLGLLSTRREKGMKLEFTRQLKESDWRRFRHYSVHVTSLSVIRSAFSPYFFRFFSGYSNELFPTLRNLEFSWPSEVEVPLPDTSWLTVTGPALRSLRLTRRPSPIPISDYHKVLLLSVLRQLPIRAPCLKELYLPGFNWVHPWVSAARHGSFTTSFNTILPTLSNLTSLSWKSTSLPTEISFTILAQPALCQLVLCDVPPRPANDDRLWLPAVDQLSLYNCSSDTIASWLGSLPHPEILEGVEFRFDEEPKDGGGFRFEKDPEFDEEDHSDWDEGSELITLPFVNTLCRAMNLAQVSIHLDSWHMVLSWRTFEPLLDCKGVSDFSLSLRHVRLMGLDDDAIEVLAESWVELERFCVIQDYPSSNYEPMPSATLYGLEPFATNCLNLREIALTASMSRDDSRLQSANATGGSGVASHALERLDLGYSEPGAPNSQFHLDARRVAQILRRFWPRLKPEAVENSWDQEDLSDLDDCPQFDQMLVPVIEERFQDVQEFMKEIDLHNRARWELEGIKCRLSRLEEGKGVPTGLLDKRIGE